MNLPYKNWDAFIVRFARLDPIKCTNSINYRKIVKFKITGRFLGVTKIFLVIFARNSDLVFVELGLTMIYENNMYSLDRSVKTFDCTFLL